MRYLSLFSGIEAATQAWHPLGWEAAAFAEIEPFPASVLAHHYPNVPNLGDVTKHQEWPDIGTVDIVCGGSPCQSFSVAGLRQGMADPRGNLILTYLAIVDKYRPSWVVYENVPGLLSSNGGRDFGSFLGGLGQLGYGFAYRVLDAQYVRTRSHPFAVPQRRRRVFVVGYLGDWRRAAAVLFDRESLSGHPAPRREAGQGAAALTANGVGTCGADDNQGQAGHLVAHSLRGEGFDASEDGTGRGTPLAPVAFDCKGTQVQFSTDGTHPTPRSMGHADSHQNGGGHAAVAFQPGNLIRGCGSAPSQDVFPTLAANHGRGQSDQDPHVAISWAVRRLIPKECARLQGFPDDHTAIPYRGKPAADGPQYKALGNSMAVNVMAYIGERIQLVEDMQ